MSALQSRRVVDESAATKEENSARTAIAHLPQVYNLTWKDDFFDVIPAAVVVFDLDVNATISPSTLWFPSWNLCHLALTTMNSILVVYTRPTLFCRFTFCHEGQLEYEHISFDTITEVTVNHDEGSICFFHKHGNHDPSQRWIRGLHRPEEFDHALVALQEHYYRTKHDSRFATR